MSDAGQDRKPVQMNLFFRPTRNATWVAKHLKTSSQTVARMVEAGELEGYKLRDGGPWCIYLDSVDECVMRRAKKYGVEHRLHQPSNPLSGAHK